MVFVSKEFSLGISSQNSIMKSETPNDVSLVVVYASQYQFQKKIFSHHFSSSSPSLACDAVEKEGSEQFIT